MKIKPRNLLITIYIIISIFILIALLYSWRLNGDINWRSISIQLLFDLILIAVFSFLFDLFSNRVKKLDTLHESITLSLLSDKVDEHQILESIKYYYNSGGEKKLTVSGKKFEGETIEYIDSINCDFYKCEFVSDKRNNPNSNLIIISNITNTRFINSIMLTTFEYYSFRNVRFEEHMYWNKFSYCEFENVGFIFERVVECSFYLKYFNVENLFFYKCGLSSCRIMDVDDNKYRQFNQGEESEIEYYLNIRTYIKQENWGDKIKLNSISSLSDISMTYKIFEGLYSKYYEMIKEIEIIPLSFKIIINPTRKRDPKFDNRFKTLPKLF